MSMRIHSVLRRFLELVLGFAATGAVSFLVGVAIFAVKPDVATTFVQVSTTYKLLMASIGWLIGGIAAICLRRSRPFVSIGIMIHFVVDLLGSVLG